MPDSKKIVWSNILDGAYLCQVREYIDTYGFLSMTRVETGETVYTRAVPISRYFREQDILWWGKYCMIAARDL